MFWTRLFKRHKSTVVERIEACTNPPTLPYRVIEEPRATIAEQFKEIARGDAP